MIIKIALLVLLLVSPVLVYYFLLRPRLQMRYTDFYAEVDGFWERQWARVYALRSFFIASAGAIVAALPELLQILGGFDFAFLPEPWPGYVAGGVSIAITLNRVLSTLPGNDKA